MVGHTNKHIVTVERNFTVDKRRPDGRRGKPAKKKGGGPGGNRRPCVPRVDQASARADLIESGVMGISRTRAPDAASIAFAIAAGTTVTTGSPVPAG